METPAEKLNPALQSMFREYDIRGRVSDEEMNEANVSRILTAYAAFLKRRGISKVVLGYDSRACSPAFADAGRKALLAAGMDVWFVGLATSPLVYYAQYLYGSPGAAMITASHNPDGWSGLKLAKGYSETLEPADIRELLSIVETFAAQGYVADGAGTEHEATDARERYISEIVRRTRMGPYKPRVVIDAGNGGAGLFAWEVFYRLGVPTFQLNCDPDTDFPHYFPNPSDGKARARLREVVTHPYIRADLGLGFDGDGDRLGVIDGTGADVWSDRILAIFARQLLEKSPGATVVYDVKCTKALEDTIAAGGGAPLMWKTGHSYIKAKMHEVDAPLAGERSGHFFFGGEDWFGFDDAIFAAAKLVEYLSQQEAPLTDVLASLPPYVTSPEIKAACADEVKYEVTERVVKALQNAFPGQVNATNGARVTFPHGWGLVRASSNMPELVLVFEADTAAHLAEIKQTFRNLLAGYPEVSAEWENDI
jgi:phosphomannomutase/phosphoglucomutase